MGAAHMSNVDTVKQMYGAFGKGDIPAIVDRMDENVAWDTQTSVPHVPWLAPRRGKTNVPAFFESLTPLHFTRFEPHTFFADGDKVFALIHIEVEANGKRYVCPNEGHLWRFGRDGRIVEYQHVTDTATHQRIAAGD
jgi:ketosteroid isomerase-like protein